MTEKTLDWLNLNSHRAYPLVNDEGIVVDGKRIPDCVLLDCTIMDTRHGIGTPDLVFRRIDVTAARTHVDFTYAGSDFGIDITGEGANGISVFDGVGGEFVHARFVFSSHDRILDEAGEGTWEFNGRVLPTKIATVEASGVMGLSTSGSAFVEGRELPGVATGDVHLVDGYRTQPVVHNGKVVVKVGNSYGLDPCHYYAGPLESPSCDDIMLFFCGQNAVNSGNVILKGGPGVTVTQGRTYLAREDIMDTFGNVGIAAGERVPCIEVKASSELMRIYRSSKPEDSSSSSSPEDSSSSEEPRLPYDAEVEHLESTGTQWIDTGVVGGSATKVRIVAASPNTSVYATLFGARTAAGNRPSFCIWQRSTFTGGPGIRFDYNSQSVDSGIGVVMWSANSINEIVKSGPRNFVNGVETPRNTAHSFALAYPFYLFNVNASGSPIAYPFIGSVYVCQIWDSVGVLVRDMIPVRFTNELGQSEGAMYDRLGVGGMNPDGSARTDGLYRNRGTGAFLYGRDIAD